LEKKPLGARIPKVVFHSVVSGIVVSIVILFIANYIFGPPWLSRLEAAGISIPEIQPPAWQGFLVSITAGVREEILFRLFLLTLFAWIGSILRKKPNILPPNWILWIATLLAAVLFGFVHLPGTAAIGLLLDSLVITRALVLNGLGGVVFGWLYWTRGLESAILAHFSADVVFHAVVPLIDQLSGI
jgi:membrane protease YdiL (CAAX protease family)